MAEQHKLIGPPCCFIDTNYFESLGFDFDAPLLKVLHHHAKAGNIVVLANPILHAEISRRARVRSSELTSKMRSLGRDAYILRALNPQLIGELSGFTDRLAACNFSEAAVALAGQFFQTCGAVSLDWSSIDIARVFMAYFDVTPPFADGKKRSEFADACIISTLDSYHNDHNATIHIVSLDRDFAGCAEQRPWLKVHGTLADVLAELPLSPSDITAEACALLEPHWPMIHRRILSKAERTIEPQPDDWDLEIENLEAIRVVSGEHRFDMLSDSDFVVSFDAEIEFAAEVSLPDPEKTYYDKEDGLVILAYRSGSVSEIADVTVQLEYTLDELRGGDFEPDLVTVESRRPLVFHVDPYDLEEDMNFYE